MEENGNVYRIKGQDLKHTEKTKENKLHENLNICFSLITGTKK